MKKQIKSCFGIGSICSAYDFRWDSNFSFAGERHDFWEFVCVLDGSVEAVEDEKVYILSAGELVCHAPMEFHRIRSYGGSEPHVLVLSFESVGELPTTVSEGPFSLSESELLEYRAIFREAYEWYHSEGDEPTLGARVSALLCAFILRIGAEHTHATPGKVGRRATEYQRIVEIMQSAVLENLSLSEIASRAAVSVSTVKVLFLEFSSISPIKYYSQLRIERAKQYLSEGMSVADVSERMGFSSPNYFSCFFKREMGVSPGKYRSKA